ncbi:MAG TPA: DJ-1 family glyoxalase III [Solimonas sp.]|nr:DJ-1 family glyoxalase III [Solimonas sp.]
MNVLVPVAHGSESLETVTLVNILRRGDIRVTVASIEDGLQVRGTRDIPLLADARLADLGAQDYDAIVVPGGEAGARALGAHPGLAARLKQQRLAHRWYGGICAAPALTLAIHELLDGKKATAYPAFRDQIIHYVDQPVVVDGHCVTGQGPAAAMAFGLKWVELLAGPSKAQEVAAALLHA